MTNQDPVATVTEIYSGFRDGGDPTSDAAARIVAASKRAPVMAGANQQWALRVAAFFAAEGITQVLDIGSGVPSQSGSVHGLVLAANPDARVVYVDNNPETVKKAADAVAGDERVAVTQGDLADAPELLHRVERLGLLDLGQPVAILMASVVHFIPDSNRATAALAALRDWMTPGSYLAMTHGATEGFSPEEVAALQAAYGLATGDLPTPRPREEIAGYFDGLGLVDPGLVWMDRWRGEPVFDPPEQAGLLAGVGRKP